MQWTFNPNQQLNINKMLTQLQVPRPLVYSSDNGSSPISLSSQDEEEPQDFDSSSSSSSSDDNNDTEMAPPVKGFVNPNYPGFQHLAHTLDFDENQLNNNDNIDVSVTMSTESSEKVHEVVKEEEVVVFKPVCTSKIKGIIQSLITFEGEENGKGANLFAFEPRDGTT